MNFDEAIKLFLMECEVKFWSPRTVSDYKYFLGYFRKWLNKELLQTTVTDIKRYILFLRERNCAKRTINKHLEVLKCFFRFLSIEKVTNDITSDVPYIEYTSKIPDTLQMGSLSKIVAYINKKKNTFHGLRNYTMFLTFIDTGLRLSELTGLKLEDIDLANGCMKVTGKGDKQRMVMFGIRLKKALMHYIARREPYFYLFYGTSGNQLDRRNVHRIIRGIGEKTGIDIKLHPHLLRHTFAKMWILNGGDVFSLQQNLGHNSLEMVRRYCNIFAKDRQIQHKKYSPLDRL